MPIKTPLIRSLILPIFSLLLQTVHLNAQTANKALAFNAITINDGLSQGMVVRIFQDHYGFMWFATLDGLNRYDGYHFLVYRHDAHDPVSITESYVQAIFEDSKGRLWIGTASGGLDLFDRETETFIHINRRAGTANSLSQGAISSISEDKYGNIWVRILDKLDKIKINKENTFNNYSISHVKVPFRSQTAFLSITKTGKVYYANANDGVIYKLVNDLTEKWSVAFNLKDYSLRQNKKAMPTYQIVQLLEDTLQGKFYVFYGGGVLCFNEKTNALEKIYRNTFFKNYSIPIPFSLDKNGIVWLAGTNNLFFFDTNSGKISTATVKDSDISRGVKHSFSTFVDHSGLLWVGTSGYGILKRNLLSEKFHHTSTLYTYSIKEANNGKIILGNSTSSREVFDRTKGELIKTGRSERLKKDTSYSAGCLISPADINKPVSWFANSNKLYCYNKVFKKNTYYLLPITASTEYDELIRCKIKDSSGNIWLGTPEGLLRFNIADKGWKVYQSSVTNNSSLNSNIISSLCLDPLEPKRFLWVGTSGGLNRMDIMTGRCTSYSVKDGLPNNVIYGILNDDNGNLWMSTNKGLSCFNPQKQTFKNFDYKDGLQGNEFNSGAYCKTKDGALFFGGVNGFNYFYPKEILNNMTIPQVVITGLKIRNQPVPVQPKGSPLTKVIYLTEKLTLPYEQNFVSFEFASMDFTYPEKNLYKYKLEGFEKDWFYSANTHSATYTNLDPGTYTFRVKGSNNDGTWNEKGTSIEVIILPPWYMTWWFRAAVVLAILFAAYTFYRYRLAQALKLQSIQDRIAGDLHDEVGSNLSNIYIFSNVAQQKATVNGDTAPLLQKITDYTQQSMEAMNDIVWMINTRNDRFENIMVRMRSLAAEFSETSGCSLHLNFDESLNNVKLNMEERKNFYLIYKEAINNIAKYAECKSVWIEMKLNQNAVTLKIVDNGKGYDMANEIKGNGIFNMKKRTEMLKGALMIESTVGEGTTLELTFKI